MSAHLSHAQVVELLPAYVLGALEPDELLAVESYLQRSSALLERLQALEEAAPFLALAAPDAPLPADARERLLARARADTRTVSAAHAGALSSAPRARLPESPWQRLVRSRRATGRRAIAVAAVAGALLLGIYTGTLRTRLAQSSEQLATLQSSLQRLQLAANEQQRLLEVVTAADTRVALASEASPAQATFFRSGDRGALIADGLPALPGDQDYQLWLVGDEPVSLGLLPRSSDGSVALVVDVPAGTPSGTVAVSVEAVGGSVRPSGPIVLQGSSG